MVGLEPGALLPLPIHSPSFGFAWLPAHLPLGGTELGEETTIR